MPRFYSFRWLIAGTLGVLFVALNYWIILRPPLNRIYQLGVSEKSLRKKWQILSQKPVLSGKTQSAQHQKNSGLRSLLRLAADKGLEVHNVNVVVQELNSGPLIHLSCSCGFESLMEFLFSLNKLPEFVSVGDFSISLNERTQLEVEMSIVLYGGAIPMLPNKYPANLNNPFCFSARPDVEAPLISMRYVGFIQQKGLTAAFMQLVGGKIITLQPGDVFGAERNKLMAINPENVTVQRIDGSQTQLKIAR